MKTVYPFQVPCENQTLATRGPAPREHFCESTQVDEAAVGKDSLRPDGTAAEPTGLESGDSGFGRDVPSRPGDWDL